MAYFPFYIEVANKKALVVGGGAVAFAKIEKFLGLGLEITVVAPKIEPQIAALYCARCERRSFRDADLDQDWLFVVAATNDQNLNREIAEGCRRRGIQVNVVDVPEECSFIFPAVVRKGPLVAAVSTSGASPYAAARLRDDMENALPDNIEEILDSIAEYRAEFKTKYDEPSSRKALSKRLWEESVRLGRALQRHEVDKIEKSLLSKKQEDKRCTSKNLPQKSHAIGKAVLVGAGAGDHTLITVRGAEALKSAEVVLYDELIDKRLLDYAPSEAEKLPVGKRCGGNAKRQEEICKLLVDRVLSGKNVVRLKGGDPFLFGRGVEEAEALKKAGAKFEVVPGITSALYIPMQAGIPATARGVSRAVHIVTARADNGELGEDVGILAKEEGTIVFLMGLAQLGSIASKLVDAGRSRNTPVAVISGGCAPEKYDVRGTLEDIVEKTKKAGVKAPVVIVVGNVAQMRIGNWGAAEGGKNTSRIK